MMIIITMFFFNVKIYYQDPTSCTPEERKNALAKIKEKRQKQEYYEKKTKKTKTEEVVIEIESDDSEEKEKEEKEEEMRVKNKELGAGRILDLKIVDDSKPPAEKM